MSDPSYPDAPDSLIATVEHQRRHALGIPRARRCPPLDVDLAALLAARVPADEAWPAQRGLGPAAKRHRDPRRTGRAIPNWPR
jgi:hypothetical protein